MTILSGIANVSPFVALVLAQMDGNTLSNFGLAGVVIGWFMFRAEKWFAKLHHAMTNLNKTQIVDIMSRPTASDLAKKLCRAELRKMDPQLADELAGE